MFIAFEGPDNVGKSTTAATLAHDEVAVYNVTKQRHDLTKALFDYSEDLVWTYDRIDWFTHMVYRLALPDREWSDERVRTVFAMPDTHLVVFTHHPQLADFKADEVVDTPISKVNPMYYYFGDYFLKLNKQLDFSLFKSVSMIEVVNDPENDIYLWKLYAFSSAVGDLSEEFAEASNVKDPQSLLNFLSYVEHVS